MNAYLDSVYGELEHPIDNDPIRRCGEDVLRSLFSESDRMIELADEKLHIFPFKDVDLCWKRLFTDASLIKAIHLSKILTQAQDIAEEQSSLIDEVISLLDMALIMVGAPMREIMVEQYFAKLQQFVDEKAPSITSSSWHRRINLDDSFPKERFQPPHIKFAIPRSTMSLSQFETHLEPLAPTPLVITGSLGHWPAFDERPWSRPSYFVEKTFHGKRLVPIELGSSYTDEDWGQKIIPFKNFMNEYLLTPQGHQTGYLAQHDLFTQIPALRNDLAVPDFCYVSPPPPVQGTPVASEEYTKVEEPLLNLWMGPAGTISPLHHDAYHNVLCQVVGKKYIRLYSPEQSDCVYPMSEANGVDMSNTSRVPIDLFEISCLDESNGEFPLFQGAKYVETVLNEGECLYIPIGWWHYVRSLTVSISVSFWWN